ncbi:MAG: GNAT family N-acetyltransferase [Propionibacteriaceae bacterium]
MSIPEPQDPPGYPRHWEADVLLSDGRIARLRPIKPDDAQLLVDFYARVSLESKYLRFFAPYPRLSASDVQRFTQVDYVDRVAFILTLGTDMIGVGRYDRLDNYQAEVAFLIEDAHQGRGIAQLLLEHLAEAARERGITAFVAEVLPQNRAMAQVFADAGYHVSREIEDGVLLVEFPINPTDTSVGVMERREHRAEGASMRRLLTPNRVVLLGPGERVQDLVHAMLSGGYTGEIVAVSTDEVPVNGVRTAPSVAAIESTIDLVVAAVPAAELGAHVIDAAHKKAHGIVVLTGTDQQVGDSRRVFTLARAYGIRAIGPDALGLINTNPAVALNASPAPMLRAGGIGLFCQSAAVGLAQLRLALDQNLGVSSFISSGDFADVTGNDVMQYWEDDEETRVCLLSLDTIGNPRKFSRIIRRLARRKPVIVFAPGRAQRDSHSGDRGGLHHAPAEAVDALFRQSGVCIVHRRTAMFDLAQVFARQPLPAGPRVKLITNSASLLKQMVDTCENLGLLAPDPVIIGAGADPETIATEARKALAGDRCDTVLCAVVSPYAAVAEGVHEVLEELAATTTEKPVLGVFVDFHGAAERDRHEGPDLPGALPVFGGATDALQALNAVNAYAHWRARDPGAVPLLEHAESDARALVSQVLAETPGGRALDQEETARLLRAYGITAVPRHPVRTLPEAIAAGESLGWDVVLKATADNVRGRPDQASVYRYLSDVDEMTDAWHDLGRLLEQLGLAGDDAAADDADPVAVARPVVQAMMPAGVPLTITSDEDAAFGPILSVGLEGLASELLGDIAFRVPPLTTVDAAAMVRDLKSAPTLFGHRGSPRVEVEQVELLLHRVAQLADDLPQVASLRLSPCVASARGVAVLGATVVLAPTRDTRDALARALG